MSEATSAVGNEGNAPAASPAPTLMTFGAADAGVCVDGVCAVPGADDASPTSPSPDFSVLPDLI